jgi:hypothetical protein
VDRRRLWVQKPSGELIGLPFQGAIFFFGEVQDEVLPLRQGAMAQLKIEISVDEGVSHLVSEGEVHAGQEPIVHVTVVVDHHSCKVPLQEGEKPGLRQDGAAGLDMKVQPELDNRTGIDGKDILRAESRPDFIG